MLQKATKRAISKLVSLQKQMLSAYSMYNAPQFGYQGTVDGVSNNTTEAKGFVACC